MDKAKKMNEGQAQKSIADAILQEGIDFHIDVDKQNILHRIGILKKSRKFIIKPLVAGTLIRISRLMVDMKFPETDINKDDIYTLGITLIDSNMIKVVELIAYAVINSEKKPDKKLIKFLRTNLTQKEIYEIVRIIVTQLDVTNFMSTIISIKGMSLLKK